MTFNFFYVKIYPPKLVIHLNHLKASYEIDNATLISKGMKRLNFFSKVTLAMDTSEGNLPAYRSIVDGAVFHGYKCGCYTIDHAH